MAVDFSQSAPTPSRVAPKLGRGKARSGLPHRANRPFYLKHHPMRWDFVDGQWIPQLGTLVLDEGLAGVDKDGDDTLAHVHAERRGWSVLPLECVPPGTPDGQYLHAYPCQDGGVFHCTAWERPNTEGGAVGNPPTITDTAGYRAFCAWLVSEGHIPAPSPNAINAALNKAQLQLEEAAKRAGRSPADLAEYEAVKARVDAMRDSLRPKVQIPDDEPPPEAPSEAPPEKVAPAFPERSAAARKASA